MPESVILNRLRVGARRIISDSRSGSRERVERIAKLVDDVGRSP
jgi:hypothetical protein